MEKPVKTKKFNDMLDYYDIIEYIEDKHKIKTRDFLGLFGNNSNESHFAKYQRETGDKMPFGAGQYPDSSGKHLGFKNEWTIIRNGERIEATKKQYDADFKLIHEQYKRYTNWLKDNPEPEYLNYWHWLLDNCFSEIHNGSIGYWNITDIIKNKNTPDWVKDITQLVYDDFKDDLDSDGVLEVWIEW